VFDEDLAKAVIQYQIRNGLQPDGHIGEKTLDALNTPIASRIEQIRANMERWRHMPEDFPPDRYALVNMADATIQIVEDSKEIYRGLVVIGKIDRKTPFIQSRVRSMIVNPSWHVPTKIAQKDILPKLRKDPHYLEKLGFVIKGNESDPYGEKIDWKKIPEREFNFSLRQAPGDQNSLGHLKFDFDNDFAVYMHGTPHQDLFDKAQRNFSSGCIRLQEPDDIGEILLSGTPGHWDADKIEKEIDGGKTRWVAIKNPMPLYVLYWSVFFDPESGAINFRKDVYDYDQILITAPASEAKP
jgi:murein L,D-transpeptidase YcbB/YkuD